MEKFIVVVLFIALAIALGTNFILGDSNSLKAATETVMSNVITDIKNID